MPVKRLMGRSISSVEWPDRRKPEVMAFRLDNGERLEISGALRTSPEAVAAITAGGRRDALLFD